MLNEGWMGAVAGVAAGAVAGAVVFADADLWDAALLISGGSPFKGVNRPAAQRTG